MVRWRPALSCAYKKITYEDFTVIDNAVRLAAFQSRGQSFHRDKIIRKALEYKGNGLYPEKQKGSTNNQQLHGHSVEKDKSLNHQLHRVTDF